MITENEPVWIEALATDLGRCPFEAIGLELLPVVSEIDLILANLSSWTKNVSTPVPAMMAPATSEIVSEPYGVCLIIGAFNYPIDLLLGPLLGAIAAGNCAAIKPSEMSAACEKAMARLLPAYLDNECFSVVCGGIEVTQTLLAQQWDKIFFTGSTRVGKIVMKAAAEHLTPVSLELGGKSPTIIDESVTDLELVTQRIMWGKCANSGQTCIAPDYVLCHAKHYEAFLACAAKTVERFYGKDAQTAVDYGRIISTGHAERLKGLLDDAPGKIVRGGKVDVKDRYVEPTIISDVRADSKIMKEEIFGPILPVFKIESIDEAIRFVHATHEKPLVLYIFGKNREIVDRIIQEVPSGGVLVNDTLFHFANFFVPFGGIGGSGMGQYHGKFSFDCFSHPRTVMRRDDHMLLDVPFRYPPYTAHGLSIFRIAAKLPAIPAISRSAFHLSLLGAALGLAIYLADKYDFI